MTLSDSIKVCLDKYATMQGRAPRSEYWWFVFFNWLVFIVVAVIFGLIGLAINGYEGAIITIGVGYPLVCLAMLIPNICVIVRRLHDTGHSGFWYFITLVPLIGGLWFLYLMIKDSDDENEYGLPVY
jgi:uncharacterized membrane protein YhaH (DUF805 family)